MPEAQLAQLRVAPGEPARLAERDPRDTLGLEKEEAKQLTQRLRDRIDELQYLLFAEAKHAVLLILQGVDASGKDGVIRRVFAGVNPQGVHVVSFKAPVGAELQHDYLWRVHAALPARGTIGVFNRSHYEDIVTVGVLGLVPEEVRTRRACSPTRARRPRRCSSTCRGRSNANGFKSESTIRASVGSSAPATST
jgi:polyphosphate kinase 2 (PPK2 family)